MLLTPTTTGLVAPMPFGRHEQRAREADFRAYLLERMRAFLKPYGFTGCAVGGDSDRAWTVVAEMGDGTPVKVRVAAGDVIQLDPHGEMGMSDGFAELVARHIADRVLEEAHRIRYPEPAPDQVKLGRLGFDGFMALEIGAELRHLLGDQAYEMDAEMRGEKEPDDPTRATNLRPASSTPR